MVNGVPISQHKSSIGGTSKRQLDNMKLTKQTLKSADIPDDEELVFHYKL